MTREKYLELKQQGSLQIAYEFYKEKYNANKHAKFLSLNEFATFLPMFINPASAFERACEYYNNKFVITELRDKDGNLIKVI